MQFQNPLLLALAMLVLTACLYGCSSRHASETTADTFPLGWQESKAHFRETRNFSADNPLPGMFNPGADDESFIKKFGDTPQVRNYLSLRKQFLRGEPLNIDEAIALLSAESMLSPTEITAKLLNQLLAIKRQLDTEGTSDFEYRYERK